MAACTPPFLCGIARFCSVISVAESAPHQQTLVSREDETRQSKLSKLLISRTTLGLRFGREKNDFFWNKISGRKSGNLSESFSCWTPISALTRGKASSCATLVAMREYLRWEKILLDRIIDEPGVKFARER